MLIVALERIVPCLVIFTLATLVFPFNLSVEPTES